MDNKLMNGLTDKEVIEKRKKYGSNEISKLKKDSFLSSFFDERF